MFHPKTILGLILEEIYTYNEENSIDDFDDDLDINLDGIGRDRRGQRGILEDDNIDSMHMKMPYFRTQDI